MAYPGGYSSEEDEFDGFMSDESEELRPLPELQEYVPPELTAEQKLNNLYFVVLNRNIAEVIGALDKGLDVNTKLRDDWTLLMLAASVGDSDMVRELISRGADVNGNKDKLTVLMIACSCTESTSFAASLDIVTQLIEKGAKVDAITRRRKTALMFAASSGNVEVVRKLLSCSDVNAIDNQGWNALFWAVNDNKPEVVHILLEAGLTFDKFDVRGNTAAHYAISQEHEEIINILPVQIGTTSTNACESSYQFENLFEVQLLSSKPKFSRDVYCMLYGMKCEHLTDRFVDISLLDFLSMDDGKLLDLGVIVPYQRTRILTGLHKFHQHIYKRKSVPVIATDSLYSTIDVSNALISAIRQIITIEASLKYISCCEDKNAMSIYNIRNKVMNVKKVAKTLNVLTQAWDSNNNSVDLITSNSNKRRPPWLKWLACLSILSVTVVIAEKVRK